MSKIPAALSISFRPFFILVALIAIINPLIWVSGYLGHFQIQLNNVSPLFWHGHEMIFGFSGAMIAGFILTASANWTSSEPYKGLALLGLIGIWIIERASYFMPLTPSALLVVSNLFLPTLAIMLFLKLRSFPKQKYVFIPILLVLTTAKVLHGWGHLFGENTFELIGKSMAGGVLRLIILLIAGRVIPFFTMKKVGFSPSVPPRLNMISLISVALLIVPWNLFVEKSFVAGLLLIALASNVFRQFTWRPEKTIKIPILFILHIGILFINLGLFLELLQIYNPAINFSQAPLHMLFAAGAGTVGVGIMTRVSLGHTGRIIAADKWICLAYGLIISGGLIRALLPIFDPGLYMKSLFFIAALWSGGFAVFLIKFWSILLTPRPDGR